MLLKICSILVVIFALTGCGNQQAAAVRQFPSGDRVVVNRVKEAVYNPDGSSVLTSYAQQLAGVTNWNASSGAFVFNIEPGKALIFQSAFLDIQEMTFSEDGRFILTRSVMINIPSPHQNHRLALLMWLPLPGEMCFLLERHSVQPAIQVHYLQML